ncbi:MAG TPA: YhjD/YihY/BrkB family envelope integrity protein [Planctomycetota bacterium]|nr:YhjD/YihY/BrkB family envelope integrity protein [Planctomycetota bacterium]
MSTEKSPTEPQFLDLEAENARKAIQRTLGVLGRDLKAGCDVKAWTRKRPWTTIGVTSGLGFLVGFAAPFVGKAAVEAARRKKPAPARGGLFKRAFNGSRDDHGAASLKSGAKKSSFLRATAIQAASLLPTLAWESLKSRAFPPPPESRNGAGNNGEAEAPAAEPLVAARPAAKRRLGPTGIWFLVRRSFSEWMDDNALRLAAALAFYCAFSIAPLLLIVIGVAGMAFDSSVVQAQVLGEMEGLVGAQGAQAIESMLLSALQPSKGALGTVLGVVMLFFGAMGVFLALQDSLNEVWDVKTPQGNGVLRFFRARLLSFGIVLGIGFLLLVSLVLSAVLSGIGKYIGDAIPFPPAVLQVLNFFISFAVITLLFALIYKVLPDMKLAWRHVWIGALVTAALFTLGKFAIGYYLGQTATGSAYGAAGSVIIILLWAYYSSLIFLFGAELTQVYAREFDTGLGTPVPVDPCQPR